MKCFDEILRSSKSICVLLALLAGLGSALALPATVRDTAVDAIAFYVPSSTSLDAALEAAGYSPPIAPSKEVMTRLPDIRKIEAAYYAAEAAHPNEGGADLLAFIQESLAHAAPAILKEGTLHFLSKRSPSPPLPFIGVKASRSKPPSPVWEAIAKLARYGSTGHGSQQQLLVKHFQLSDEAAYEILRNSATFGDALQKSYAKAPANGPKNLRSLAKALAEHSPAIRHDEHVAAIFPDKKFPPDQPVVAQTPSIFDGIDESGKLKPSPYGDLFKQRPEDDIFKRSKPYEPGFKPGGPYEPGYRPYRPYQAPYRPYRPYRP